MAGDKMTFRDILTTKLMHSGQFLTIILKIKQEQLRYYIYFFGTDGTVKKVRKNGYAINSSLAFYS